MRSRWIYCRLWLTPSGRPLMWVPILVATRYTLPLSRLARHVHAFEPHPRLAYVLSAALDDNVSVHQVLVSDEPGVLELTTPIIDGKPSEGISRVGGFNDGVALSELPVEAVTLDELADRPIGFIKIDVEGHELNVLEGARELLDRQQPIILIEVEDRHRPHAIASVRSFMEAKNYSGFFVHSGKMNPISDHKQEMQDDTLLQAIESGQDRRTVPYVNNFIFIPERADISEIIHSSDVILAAMR
ncbi:MAG: FkbM family methyltransferase [Alphaproteobacteria bacterium]|nr:FkbM family methyltransferase [Alphaproteobacteria bacterium]